MLTYERFILICDYFKNYPDWSDTMFPKVGKKIERKHIVVLVVMIMQKLLVQNQTKK